MNKKTLSRADAFERLEAYTREAQAGAPDTFLAKKADVSVFMVREWRNKFGLRRQRGKRRSVEEHRQFASTVMGHRPPDVLMRADASPLDGRWEVPEFVLRGVVDYPGHVQQIHYLHRKGGFSPEAIAKAHGYTQKTVDQAIALVDREKAKQ